MKKTRELSFMGNFSVSFPSENISVGFTAIGRFETDRTPRQVKGDVIKFAELRIREMVQRLSEESGDDDPALFSFNLKVLPKKEENLLCTKKNEAVLIFDSEITRGKTIDEVILPEVFEGMVDDSNIKLLKIKRYSYVFENVVTGEKFTLRMVKA